MLITSYSDNTTTQNVDARILGNMKLYIAKSAVINYLEFYSSSN